MVNLLCAVRNGENIAVFLSLIVYRCIPDPSLCSVGKWRYSHIYLELAIGQRLRKSAIGVCNQVSPYLSSTDISSAVVSLSVAMYCSTVIAWIVSTSSRCENWNYYSIYYEDYRHLECCTVWSGIYSPVFWRNVLTSSSKPEGELFWSMLLLPDEIYSTKNYCYYQHVVAQNSSI